MREGTSVSRQNRCYRPASFHSYRRIVLPSNEATRARMRFCDGVSSSVRIARFNGTGPYTGSYPAAASSRSVRFAQLKAPGFALRGADARPCLRAHKAIWRSSSARHGWDDDLDSSRRCRNLPAEVARGRGLVSTRLLHLRMDGRRIRPALRIQNRFALPIVAGELYSPAPCWSTILPCGHWPFR